MTWTIIADHLNSGASTGTGITRERVRKLLPKAQVERQKYTGTREYLLPFKSLKELSNQCRYSRIVLMYV